MFKLKISPSEIKGIIEKVRNEVGCCYSCHDDMDDGYMDGDTFWEAVDNFKGNIVEARYCCCKVSNAAVKLVEEIIAQRA